MLKKLSIAVALTWSCVASWGQVLITGAGTLGCGEYIEHRLSANSAQDSIYATWTWGYLAGYNMYTKQKKIDPPDKATVLAYLDKHCRDNPLENVMQGGIRLVDALGGNHARSVR